MEFPCEAGQGPSRRPSALWETDEDVGTGVVVMMMMEKERKFQLRDRLINVSH